MVFTGDGRQYWDQRDLAWRWTETGAYVHDEAQRLEVKRVYQASVEGSN